ncbi:MAG: peptidase M28, partial [Gammaproteobacteria bacterium]|nr:peptidase M28 [Gammaproteobacteria bacterium]
MQKQHSFTLWILCLLWLPLVATAQVHHSLDVSLQPDTAGIEVRDSVTLPEGHPSSLTFALHPALKPALQSGNARLVELAQRTDNSPSAGISPRHYRLDLDPGENSFTLHYSGNIAHTLQSRGEEYARSFQQTQGIISPQGVFLSGTSVWYPHIDATQVTFDLKVHLPKAWKSMSQGEQLDTRPATGSGPVEHWRASNPQQEIYLIAGPFNAWSRVDKGVTAMVLLREPDAALARKYLDATHQYIARYDTLIGRYPFTKFAMVENFWETGYGMPSFTLLGSRVIRFPFILASS